MNNISLQYPVWFILFCVLLGAVYAVLLYFNDGKFKEIEGWKKVLMAIFRFLSVSIIAFLLLSPVIKSIEEQIKEPIIIIAEDKSKSILTIPNDKLSVYSNEMSKLVEELKEDYEVVRLNFGEDVVPARFDSFTYNSTNLSQTLNYIHDNYVDQNVGAIILSTDGIYNEGRNPVYDDLTFKSPLYSIALGDTSLRKDLSVSNILYNKIAYLGDQTRIEVDVKSLNAIGSRSRVRLYQMLSDSKKLIAEKPYSIDNKNDFRTFDFIVDATSAGINQYQIEVSPVKDEISFINNTRSFYIEVIDSKQKILILADGPHPDIGALKNIITNNKNYEVETEFVSNRRLTVRDYDLIILHNLPSTEHDIINVMKDLEADKIPRLYIGGTTISQAKFNQNQDILKLTGNSNSNEDVEPQVVSDFTLFTLSNELLTQIKRYPPLTAKFGSYELNASATVLLTQKIKKVPTNYPLLAFQDVGGIKSAAFMAEGIWRWRVFDFQELKNDDNISELINKTIQYLTLKEDKRKFRVNLAKNVYNESEDIIFDGQLYNDSYELINTSDVLLNIKDEDGKNYKFSFSKTNNYYTLNAGQFSDGNYTFDATVNYNGTTLSSKGKFSVRKIELEQYDLTANHRLLYALSDKYNGKVVGIDSISQISQYINASDKIKPSIYSITTTSNLLNRKWIFWVIIAFLSIEWFLRRFYGSY